MTIAEPRSLGRYISDIVAGPAAVGAQAPSPDSTRKTMNWVALCANPHARMNIRKRAADHSTTGRRPASSDVGARINVPTT
jgi:hypothetical protein